jgi:DNA-binding XRE family transcriptional regulator
MENQNNDLKPNNGEKRGETQNSSSQNFFLMRDVSVCKEIPLKNRVKILLLRKGMSQNQLADEIGISKSTMSKIIRGRLDTHFSNKIKDGKSFGM